jgi:protein-disulfide isomerase
MKLTVGDIAAVGILACAVVLTASVLKDHPAPQSSVATTFQVFPRPDLDLVGQVIGRADAGVRVVVFSDFQCPFCAASQPVLRELLRADSNRVQVVYRHLPLETIHPHSWTAALAAECAGDQGRFRAFHDMLFDVQDSIGLIPWVEVASRSGVASPGEFAACLAEERHLGRVERDVLLARDLGVDRTPTFIVGDQGYRGTPPRSWLSERIRQAERRQGLRHGRQRDG